MIASCNERDNWVGIWGYLGVDCRKYLTSRLFLIALQSVDFVGFGVVCPAGLEPATLSLEGSCSIQLSYGHALFFVVR